MTTITATDYANLRRELAETEELMHVAEQENSELRARVAALKAALDAANAVESDDYEDSDNYSDSDWDCCSCMTPEMCRGGCCTSEDFEEWVKEEKEKGETHKHPVRDFKEARNGLWGFERALIRAEKRVEDAEESYRAALMSNPDSHSYDRMCSNYEDEVENAKSHLKWLKEEHAKRKEQISSAASSGCTGCREGQPNQLAHMDPGGCLYSDE